MVIDDLLTVFDSVAPSLPAGLVISILLLLIPTSI